MNLRRVLLSGCLSVAAVLLYGCAAADTGGPVPAVSAVPSPTALLHYPLPLDRFRASDEDNRTIGRARARLVQNCMRRVGFAGYVVADPAPPTGSDGPDEFGFLNAGRAATLGFHEPEPPAGKPTGAGAGSARGDTPAEIAALSGTAAPGGQAPAGQAPPGGQAPAGQAPPGGCAAEAERELRAGLPTGGTSLVSDLAAQADTRTLADPRVVRATVAWAGCMAAAGWTYRSPADPVSEQWAPDPTPTEIAIAVADVDCTRHTNLPGIAMAVMAAIEEGQIRANGPGLRTARAAVDAYLSRAERILAGGGA